jgi:3-oxoacyl-[acyl-carrier protein] reductase
MVDLKGKLAVVAGGARDIGKAVCVEMAKCGASVAFCYSPFGDPKEAESTLAAVRQHGVKVFSAKVDAVKSDEVKGFIAAVQKEFNRPIDILVNVVGGLVGRKRIEEIEEGWWDSVIALNLKTPFIMSQAALPHMPDGAVIVNFSSQAARDGGGPGAIAYSAAKGGVTTLTRGMAKELGPRRIRVNAVAPGMINTTFHNTFTKPEVRQRVASMTPLGREGESCEIAQLVAYLVSSESSFINGACIDVNGGTYFS